MIYILFAQFKSKENRWTFNPHRFLFFLYAFFAFILQIGGIMYSRLDYSHMAICVLQSLHITYFNQTLWFFSVAISLNLLFMLNVYFFPFNAKKRKICIIIVITLLTLISIFVPLLLTLLTLIFLKDFTAGDGWCSIE